MIFFKQKKGDSSIGTAIAVITSVVLGGLILAGFIYLIDNNISPGMTNVFNDQQINISRVVSEEGELSEESTKGNGDVNGDGQINNEDLELFKDYTKGYNVEINTVNADVNGDGVINLKDLGVLNKLISENAGIQNYDINKDGYTDEKDVTYLERYLAGWTGYSEPEYGDINGDGVINNNDLNILKSQIEK